MPRSHIPSALWGAWITQSPGDTPAPPARAGVWKCHVDGDTVRVGMPQGWGHQREDDTPGMWMPWGWGQHRRGHVGISLECGHHGDRDTPWVGDRAHGDGRLPARGELIPSWEGMGFRGDAGARRSLGPRSRGWQPGHTRSCCVPAVCSVLCLQPWSSEPRFLFLFFFYNLKASLHPCLAAPDGCLPSDSDRDFQVTQWDSLGLPNTGIFPLALVWQRLRVLGMAARAVSV